MTVASVIDEDFNWDMDDEDDLTPTSSETPPSRLPLLSTSTNTSIPSPLINDLSSSTTTPLPVVSKDVEIDNDSTPRKSSAVPATPSTPAASTTPSLSYANSPKTPSSTQAPSMAAFSSSSASEDESRRTSSEGAGSSFDVVGEKSGDPSEIDEGTKQKQQDQEAGSEEDSDWE
jgi:hypothetical protein